MKKLIFVTVTVLAILTLPYAQAQTTLTVNTFGAKWPQRTIGVNIPPDNEQNYFVDNMALHAMQKWNAAMNWFMETYYPSENVPLELVQSSSGQVTVVITYRNNYELSGSTTYLQTEGYFTQMTVQLLLSTQETVAKYFPSTEDYIDNVLSLVTHEFGHVLGLGEAPSTETYDIMCMRVLPSSKISTLDLYGILQV